ncbi:hypothetical protein TNCV_1956751 [Trichonephila clavipes]|nr:hypothetical protein TNCV_1956751 [Trichonephila clavipes]
MRNRDSSNQETLFHLYFRSSLNVSKPTLRAPSDDAWLAEIHEWGICCTVPYPTVSAKLAYGDIGPPRIHFGPWNSAAREVQRSAAGSGRTIFKIALFLAT